MTTSKGRATPSVLLVIPTLNEVAHIESVLLTLLADLPTKDCLVVVADGGSDDGTTEVVERLQRQHPQLYCVHNPRRVQSAGVNLAARRFGEHSDVLLRCDAHGAYPANFCRRLLDTLESVGADAVAVGMDSCGSSCLQRAIGWVSNSLIGTGGSAHRAGRKSGFVDHGHHAAIRMSVFRELGGYDESFTHNEDAEFDCRQRALGAKVYLDADIRIQYRPRSSFGALWKQYFNYGAGRSRTIRRHPHSARLRQLAVPLNLIATALALTLWPWQPLLLSLPGAYLLVLAGASLYFAIRHRCLCGLATGPAAYVMHTAWGLGFFSGFARFRERAWRPELAVSLGFQRARGGRP